MLPTKDIHFLDGLGLEYSIHQDAGMIAVVVRNYQLPPGYAPDVVDLMLRLQAGYPDLAPDMFWVKPGVTLSTGAYPEAAELFEDHLGERWQRFSRHLDANQWRSGVDGLSAYFALIRKALLASAPEVAA